MTCSQQPPRASLHCSPACWDHVVRRGQSYLQGADADGSTPQPGAAGAGGSAQRGPPQRSAADAARTQQEQQQQAAHKPLEANPLRGLGSAMERWRARLAVGSDAPEPAQVLTAHKVAKQLRFSYPGNALTLGHWSGDRCLRERMSALLRPGVPCVMCLLVHLQDEGAAAAERQAGEQEGQPEPDAEFQYMHEDESAAAGDTQVHTCSAGNLCVPCGCLV